MASLAALAILVLAAPATAQETLQVTAHDDGSDLYFMVEGLEGQNPTIRLEPGTQVRVEFTNEGPDQVHNLHFGGPIDEGTEVLQPGQSRTLNLTIPDGASGSHEYWCDPHRSQGMVGDLDLGGGDGNGAPGPAFLLAAGAVAVALALRRR